MKRTTKLKIVYWVFLFTSCIILAFYFPMNHTKDYVLAIVMSVFFILCGYIDRIIDEERNKETLWKKNIKNCY